MPLPFLLVFSAAGFSADGVTACAETCSAESCSAEYWAVLHLVWSFSPASISVQHWSLMY